MECIIFMDLLVWLSSPFNLFNILVVYKSNYIIYYFKLFVFKHVLSI